MWSLGCRRFVSQVVLDDGGSVAGSFVEASALMHRHWALVFENDAPTDEASVQTLLSFVQKFRGSVALPSLEEFADIIRRTPSTAPGPDGLCYGAWGADCGNVAALYGCLKEVWSGEGPPQWFNAAVVVFTPKAALGAE